MSDAGEIKFRGSWSHRLGTSISRLFLRILFLDGQDGSDRRFDEIADNEGQYDDDDSEYRLRRHGVRDERVYFARLMLSRWESALAKLAFVR